jgi:hypothetical protein
MGINNRQKGGDPLKSKSITGSLVAMALSLAILTAAKAQEHTVETYDPHTGTYDPFPGTGESITDMLDRVSRPYPEVNAIVKNWTQRLEDESVNAEAIRAERQLEEAQERAVQLYHLMMRRAGLE